MTPISSYRLEHVISCTITNAKKVTHRLLVLGYECYTVDVAASKYTWVWTYESVLTYMQLLTKYDS